MLQKGGIFGVELGTDAVHTRHLLARGSEDGDLVVHADVDDRVVE